MSAFGAWCRLDFRRRWRSLVVLAFLVAFAAGTVMTAVAGARRGATAVDRLVEQTLPATVLVGAVTPGFDWAPVRALPEVEALAGLAYSGYEIDGRLPEASVMLPPVDTEAMRTVERPVVIAGRLADPGRADEVVVTPRFEQSSGKGVGDTLSLGLFTPEQVDIAQGPDGLQVSTAGEVWLLTAAQMGAAIGAGTDPNVGAPAAGPVVEATIVGVVSSPWFGDLAGDGYVIPSAGLYAQYTPHFLGAQGLASTNALVRLGGGEAAIPAFQQSLAEVTGSPDIAVVNLVEPVREARDVTGFEAGGLLVFAAVAGVASVVLVGLSLARYVAATATDLRILGAVGMSPGQARLVAAGGPALAALAGAVLGAGGSVVASRWFPVGTAAVVEPAPGVQADAAVLAAGLLGVPLLVGVAAAVAARFSLAADARAVSPRRSAVAAVAATTGLPVPVAVGTRFALEPGRGRQAVPVRPALLGVVAGVAGVLAAVTFTGAVDDAATNPARHGIVSQLEVWVGFDGVPNAPAEAVFSALVDAPGVTGINDTRGHVAESGGEQFTVLTFEPIGTPLDYVVTEGRLPVGSAEVMLGRRTADTAGAGVGDTITLTGTRAIVDLVVVGMGFIEGATGAVTTAAAFDTLFGDDFAFHYGDIALTPGADPEQAIPGLFEALAAVPDADLADAVGILPAAQEVSGVFRYLRQLPVFLAGFLVVLAVGAVGHALTSAVRRRRHDVAVLRAVGMTPSQCRGVVATQATVVALVGLVVGIPLGIALGRTVWRFVADVVQVHYVPPAVWLALVLAVPVALLATNLLAAWPSHRAATLRVGHVMRAE